MRIRLVWLLAAIMVAGLGAAQAQDATTTFESCVDAKGRALPAMEDGALPTLVTTVNAKGERTIHYNPALLPNLKPITRLFFFAHECARNALGFADKGTLSVEQAHQADCLGLATMQDSGKMQPAELAELQEDLKFSDADWSKLPGPARDIDLAACHSTGVVKLPMAATPTAGQSDWDHCVMGCADPLLKCGSGCMDTYQKCVAACGPRPEK